MPTIPTYESKRQLTTETPFIKKSAELEAQAGIGGILKGAGELISDVSDKMLKISNANAESKSDIESTMDFSVYEDEVNKNPDALNDADNRINMTRNKVLKNFKDPIARKEYLRKFDLRAIKFKIDLKNNVAKKQIKELEIAGDRSAMLIAENNFTPSAKEDIENIYKKQVELGVLLPAEAQKKIDTALEKNRTTKIAKDIASDSAITKEQSYVYNQLKLGGSGDYADLTVKERAEYFTKLEQKIRRNQILFQFDSSQNQNKNEVQMLINRDEGKLDISQVKDALLSLSIRRPFGEKMLEKLYAIHPEVSDYKVYNDIRELQNTNASAQEINEKILDSLEKLSAQDTKDLINKTYAEIDKKQKIIIRYNADALKNWAKQNLSLMPEMQADLVYEFHRRINQSNAQGSAIDVIAQELQKEKIKEIYPPTALMNDVPNFVSDRKRLKKVYEKESKLKGKTQPKPTNVIIGGTGMGYDDF